MSEFQEEVQLWIMDYIGIAELSRGWCVWLEPEMLAGTHLGFTVLPPGQGIVPQYAHHIVGEIIDVPSHSDGRFFVLRLNVAPNFWACRAHFRSRDSALRMMFGWIYQNRHDIVAITETEIAEAIRWRKRKAA